MIDYWFDRFVLSPFIPAALVLALATAWPGSPNTTAVLLGWLVGAPFMLLALAQLRLWDDLADRDRDRRDHPDRILCDVNPVPYAITVTALAGTNLWLLLTLGAQESALRFVAMNIAVVCYYAFRPKTRTASSDALLLIKYPALVLVLAPITTDPFAVVVVVMATYAAAFAYEMWHDPTGPLRANS
jgi:hypothetical protein